MKYIMLSLSLVLGTTATSAIGLTEYLCSAWKYEDKQPPKYLTYDDTRPFVLIIDGEHLYFENAYKNRAKAKRVGGFNNIIDIYLAETEYKLSKEKEEKAVGVYLFRWRTINDAGNTDISKTELKHVVYNNRATLVSECYKR